MKKGSYKIIMSFFVLLLSLMMQEKVATAREINQSTVAKVYEEFAYEYEGASLIYSVQKLAEDNTYGTVSIKGWEFKPSDTIDLKIPATVSYKEQLYRVTYFGSIFKGSKKIRSISIPNTITNISYNAFENCTFLTEVYLSEGLTAIGGNAFEGCTQLKRILIPESLKSMGEEAFKNCTSLESITFPKGMTHISRRLLKNCMSLSSVYLPPELIDIHPFAFEDTNIIFTVERDSYAAYACKTNRLDFCYSSDTGKDKVALDGIIQKESEFSLIVGRTKNVDIIYFPYNTTDNRSIQWTSSDNSIAKVDFSGMVTGLRPGVTNIIAKVGNYTARCTVVVNSYAPKGVKAVPAGLNRIHISWKPVNGAESYEIRRATTVAGPYSWIGTSHFATEYEDKKVANNQTYYYKICATNGISRSNYSAVASAKPGLSTPTVSVIPISDQSIKLRWDMVPNAEGYLLYRSTSKKGPFKQYKKNYLNYMTDKSVGKGKTYYYYVKAYHKSTTSKTIFSSNSPIMRGVAKAPVKPSIVTLGTARADVYKILGKPYKKYYVGEYQELYYKDNYIVGKATNIASIYLKRIDDVYYVIGWYNLYPKLKVSDGYEDDSGTFTLGSTWEMVAKSMKTPGTFELKYGGGINMGPNNHIIFTTTTITYPNESTVSFDSNSKVNGWNNTGNLKVKYGSNTTAKQVITLGSTLTDIVKTYGTPDELKSGNFNTPEYTRYGKTELYFNKFQQLVGWKNKGKMNISIGQKVPGARKAKIGDSVDEVFKVMGTPDSLTVDSNNLRTLKWLYYGSHSFELDHNQRVVKIINK